MGGKERSDEGFLQFYVKFFVATYVSVRMICGFWRELAPQNSVSRTLGAVPLSTQQMLWDQNNPGS